MKKRKIYGSKESKELREGLKRISDKYGVARSDVMYAVFKIAEDVVGGKLKRDLKDFEEVNKNR